MTHQCEGSCRARDVTATTGGALNGRRRSSRAGAGRLRFQRFREHELCQCGAQQRRRVVCRRGGLEPSRPAASAGGRCRIGRGGPGWRCHYRQRR